MVMLRMDEHQVQRIRERSNKTYSAALSPLIEYLERHGADPLLEELDEIMMEYKQDEKRRLTRAKFGTTVAALMHVFPMLERLPWAQSSSSGWLKAEPPTRTAPLPKWLSPLYQAELSSSGYEEAGVMSRVQSMTGMRPGEMLAALPEDVLLPPDQANEPGLHGCTLLRLGKTKRGRPQVVVIRPPEEEEDKKTLIMLRRLKERTPRGKPMANISYPNYRNSFLRTTDKYQLPFRIRPHSPRVAFATDNYAKGVAKGVIMDSARWERDDTFKGYLDEVAAMSVSVGEHAARLGATSRHVELHLDRYFPNYYY